MSWAEDLTPEREGPFTHEVLPRNERGPHPVTEESVRELLKTMVFTPEQGQDDRLKGAERALRRQNKAYNSRTIVLKDAIAEFHKVIGYKPIQAKHDVWLPCGRLVAHAEFIDNLHAIIKEYQPCSVSNR